jgi:hypothetical protein
MWLSELQSPTIRHQRLKIRQMMIASDLDQCRARDTTVSDTLHAQFIPRMQATFPSR